MKAAIILKQKINSQALTIGALSTFHFWPGLVEIAINSGMDYFIIDLEHLTFDAERVAEACAIGRRADFPILIRPPAAEFTPIRLIMDLGPCGLLIPYVESVETLNVVREAVYLRPRGRRRPGGLGNRWVKDYNYSSWKTEVEDNLIIMPQIESKVGLKNVNAIAQDPLTTAMAIGPYDLSADLGVCWQPDNPKLVQAFSDVREAGKEAGKNMWVIGDSAKLIKQGFNFICVAETTMLLEGALKEMAQRLKSGEAPPPANTNEPLP